MKSARDPGQTSDGLRRAYQELRQRQRRLNVAVFGAVAVVAGLVSGYAYVNFQRAARERQSAEQVLVSIKELDLAMTAAEQRLVAEGRSQPPEDVRQYRSARLRLTANHDQLVSRVRGRPASAREELVLGVTRSFGECDVTAPPDYVKDVIAHVNRWRDTGRYATAVGRARDKGYVATILDELRRQRLPAQFFYLAMHESDFIDTAVSPPSAAGYAKGLWMFLSDTGQRYGLNPGPLAAYPRPDANDERQDWRKATRAAAAYLRDIYATDAQASGLLAMALYHRGEHPITDLIRSLPANPRERTFWRLLRGHRDRIPPSAYDYVMSIVSATVIGENPRLFGFDFDNPLAEATSRGR